MIPASRVAASSNRPTEMRYEMNSSAASGISCDAKQHKLESLLDLYFFDTKPTELRKKNDFTKLDICIFQTYSRVGKHQSIPWSIVEEEC